MSWQTTGDVAEFLAAAGSFLRAERARNTVILTAAETVRVNPGRFRGKDDAGDANEAGGAKGSGGAKGAKDANEANDANEADSASLPLFGWWTDGRNGTAGAVKAAFLHTPPFPVVLSAVPPEAAADLAAQALAGRPLAGVNAHGDAAASFAAAWQASTGCRAEVHRRMRLYRLAELAWPDPPPAGGPRTAGDGDVALLTDWFTAFAVEVQDTGGGAAQAAVVRDRLSYDGITLWERTRGKPVCVAALTRRVAGMVRVGPVYTPPEFRGRGYASATTAEVSRAAITAGADEVVLFTDLANPVSNSIYQRIGYREVEDRVVLSFAGP